MRSFEIFVAPEPSCSLDPLALESPRPAASPPPASGSHRRSRTVERAEVLDVFIEGANVTARVTERQATCVLRDLALALVELATAPRAKHIVRFYEEAWELAIERFGAVAAVSVYRAGSEPQVFVYDRFVAFRDVVDGVLDALDRTLSRGPHAAPVEIELAHARDALRSLALGPRDDAQLAISTSPTTVTVEVDGDAPIGFGAELVLRSADASARLPVEPPVERADLHALLFPGRMRAEVRGRNVDLGEGHPFLFAERLLQLSKRTLEAWERGMPLHVRTEAGGPILGVRLSSAPEVAEVDAPTSLALVLGPARAAAEPTTHTFPALSVADVVEAALDFGRALVRALVRRDRSQAHNLRLAAFRRELRDLAEALREAFRRDSKVNPTPELYRAFVPPPRERPRDDSRPARLAYAQRWRALVPGIDLRGTFLCGDRLVVGTSFETFCLARSTGEVLWRTPTERGTSVATPNGIARLLPDGSLRVLDLRTGETTIRTRIAARVGGPAAGAVVHGSGLPKLLVVTEGERHLVAIDLTSGEARWRFAWGPGSRAEAGARGGVVRMKRRGKLLYLTCADSALTALDVTTGTVVWRVRDRLRFRALPAFDHDALFAIAGGTSSATQLYGIDPFSGQVRWRTPMEPGTVEGSPLSASGVVALAVRRTRGLELVAFDRETGSERWRSRTPLAPHGTSWLAVDDLFIGNAPTGELVAIEAATGALRYRHVLGRVLEADTPRRLEPVLRSGALFVPHVDVHVFRPSDGGLLAHIGPCDAIPDLLRVDERCDVFVAEESGHLVSFSAGPRLRLV
jgi:outer membrane protein assembly factor BamB